MSRGYEMTWHGVSSLTIPEFGIETIQRDVLGAHRGELEDVPGQEGALYYPEERGMRDLSIQAYVLTEGPDFGPDRGDAFERVAEWLQVDGRQDLILGDWSDRVYRAILTTVPKPREWRNLGRFEINFWTDPYSLATAASRSVTPSGIGTKLRSGSATYSA